MENDPCVRALRELDAAILAIEQMCPYELEEDIHPWGEFTPAELRALILAEAGPDRAKRARYFRYVLEYFDRDEAEPRVAAARALLG
jgi:hypothetical protein